MNTSLHFPRKYGRIANLDIAPDFTAVAVVTPGTSGPYSGTFPAGLDQSRLQQFLAARRTGLEGAALAQGPRSCAPVTESTTTGRPTFRLRSRLAQQPPFAISNSVNTSPGQGPHTLGRLSLRRHPPDVTNTYAIDRNYRTPYAQTWNLSIQHELPAGFFVGTGLLGTKGTRLDVQRSPMRDPGSCAAAQLSSAMPWASRTIPRSAIRSTTRCRLRLQRRFRERHLDERLLHLLQVDRRFLQLRRRGQHRGAELAGLERRARSLELRSPACST